MSNATMNPAAGHSDTGHGHDGFHATDPNLAHHFDTPDQQFQSSKLGMWVFLGTEILMFGGLFCAYAVYRHNHPEVFEFAHKALDKKLGAINTIVLITSSLTMAWGVRAAQMGKQALLVGLLALTILGGFGFMAIKSIEYHHKWENHLWVGAGNRYNANFKGSLEDGEHGESAKPALVAAMPGAPTSAPAPATVPAAGATAVAPAAGTAPVADPGDDDPSKKPLTLKIDGESLLMYLKDPAIVEAGHTVFSNSCVACHGPEGAGIENMGPNLTDNYYINIKKLDDFVPFIRAGKVVEPPGVSMLAWGPLMAPDDIVKVAVYAASIRGKNLTGKKREANALKIAPWDPNDPVEIEMPMVHADGDAIDPNAGTSDAAKIRPSFLVPAGLSTAFITKVEPVEEVKFDELGRIDQVRVNTFFSIYFVMTGLHGVHVLVGMSLIFWILYRAGGNMVRAWALPMGLGSIGLFFLFVGFIVESHLVLYTGIVICVLGMMWAVRRVPKAARLKQQQGEFGPTFFTPVDLVGLYWHIVDLIWIFLFPLLYLIH